VCGTANPTNACPATAEAGNFGNYGRSLRNVRDLWRTQGGFTRVNPVNKVIVSHFGQSDRLAHSPRVFTVGSPTEGARRFLVALSNIGEHVRVCRNSQLPCLDTLMQARYYERTSA